MNKSLLLVATIMLTVALSGCGAGYAGLRSENRANLMKLDLGMTKEQVLKAMGDKSFGEVSNPFKREVIPGKGGETYDVLYYYTEYIDYAAGKDWESGVTPIVLKEGKVVGWGWKYLDDADIRKTITIKRK
jgi:hypothetical protein